MKFEKTSFKKRLLSMLKVDFKRLFTMPLVYIMAGVSLLLPILILVMTSMVGEGGEGFTSVWQAIGSAGDAQTSMDLTGMCNINMMYFLVVVFVCVFVADDFRSGYAKNLFTVRAKKTDYIVSKSLAGFAGGAIMILVYFVGAMLGGAIAGLPFELGAVSGGEVFACLLCKVLLVALFVSIALLLGVVAKQRLWISVLGSFGASMLLFTMLPMISPLDASFLNVVLCLAGGAMFGFGLGAIGNLILNKTNLV